MFHHDHMKYSSLRGREIINDKMKNEKYNRLHSIMLKI